MKTAGLIALVFCMFGFFGCDQEDDCQECADCPADDDQTVDDDSTDDDTVDDDTSADDDTNGFEDPQHEITELTPLLNPDGTLAARGWARAPLMQYNPETIPDDLLIRKKEWDHYTIVSPDFAVTFTLSDIRIATFAAWEVVDFQTEKIYSGTDLMVGSQGTIPLSPAGNTYYEHRDSFMTMINSETGARTVTAHIEKSLFSVEMDCDIVMQQNPTDQDVATAAPFDEEGTLFFYENKWLGMPTSGQITVEGLTYELDPAVTFAILDWGRGVWPHTHEWHWGSAAGYQAGGIIGFNIGTGWSLDSLGTANTQKYHGVLHKLYYLNFDYDPNAMMEPWLVTSDDGRFEVTLEPFYHQKTGLMVLDLGMLVDKMYGIFSGKMTLDDGTVVEFDQLFGFIEHSYQKW